MFTGEHYHTLDAKNRIAMPSKLREELGESFMVARSLRGNCIKVYSMEEWEIFLKPILETPRKTSEATLRYLHRNAAQVTPDSQGRILLPQKKDNVASLTLSQFLLDNHYTNLELLF